MKFEHTVTTSIARLADTHRGPVWLYWINLGSFGIATAIEKVPADASHVSARAVIPRRSFDAIGVAQQLISTLEKRKS